MFAIAFNAVRVGPASCLPMTTDRTGVLKHLARDLRMLRNTLFLLLALRRRSGVGGATRIPEISVGMGSGRLSVPVSSEIGGRMRLLSIWGAFGSKPVSAGTGRLLPSGEFS